MSRLLASHLAILLRKRARVSGGYRTPIHRSISYGGAQNPLKTAPWHGISASDLIASVAMNIKSDFAAASGAGLTDALTLELSKVRAATRDVNQVD